MPQDQADSHSTLPRRRSLESGVGLLVVDQVTPRSLADALVLVMGDFDLNTDGRNVVDAFNGIPDPDMRAPIGIRQNALVRLDLQRGRCRVQRRDPGGRDVSDAVTLGMAERRIPEFRSGFTGDSGFHLVPSTCAICHHRRCASRCHRAAPAPPATAPAAGGDVAQLRRCQGSRTACGSPGR